MVLLADCVHAFLGRARTERNLSPHTVAAYSSDLAAFVDWCARGDVTAAEAVDLNLCRRWLASLETRGQARSTIARKATSVRAMFDDCVERDVLPKSPMAG